MNANIHNVINNDETFDLVITRAMVGCIAQQRRVFATVYSVACTDGYIIYFILLIYDYTDTVVQYTIMYLCCLNHRIVISGVFIKAKP